MALNVGDRLGHHDVTALRRCFEKDPRQRVQAIGDVRLAMEGAFETTVQATPELGISNAAPAPRSKASASVGPTPRCRENGSQRSRGCP